MSSCLHLCRPGLFFALVALVAQLVLGAAAPDAGMRPTRAQQMAALLADYAAICHGMGAAASMPRVIAASAAYFVCIARRS